MASVNVRDILNGNIELPQDPHKGALYGDTVKPISRFGDVQNAISIGTASAFVARDIFKESTPYYKEYDEDGILTIFITFHFLRGLRRQLSGDIVEGTSTFSPEEAMFYWQYQEWVYGSEDWPELEQAFATLDAWLVDEIMGVAHLSVNRDYSLTHPWRKTEESADDLVFDNFIDLDVLPITTDYPITHPWRKTEDRVGSLIFENFIGDIYG